jgi:hypothetical protein
MKTLLYGLAIVPFLSVAALAQPSMPSDAATLAKQPVSLSEKQMDGITAGWSLLETDVSNTSWVQVSVYQQPNTITCPSCYILINSPTLSIGSHFLP